MAKTFPISVADFFGKLPITTITPDLTEAMEMSRSVAGELFTATNGPRLWRTEITLRGGGYQAQERFRAMVDQLRSPGRSLLVPALPRQYPEYDPDGSKLVGYTPKLQAVASNNRDITIKGLPPFYELRYGDCLSFTYSNNPVRYALHRVVSDSVANSAGVVVVEVIDFIRPGYALDANIVLTKPFYKAIMVPSSASLGSSGQQQTAGIGFTVQQTFR